MSWSLRVFDGVDGFMVVFFPWAFRAWPYQFLEARAFQVPTRRCEESSGSWARLEFVQAQKFKDFCEAGVSSGGRRENQNPFSMVSFKGMLQNRFIPNTLGHGDSRESENEKGTQ